MEEHLAHWYIKTPFGDSHKYSGSTLPGFMGLHGEVAPGTHVLYQHTQNPTHPPQANSLTCQQYHWPSSHRGSIPGVIFDVSLLLSVHGYSDQVLTAYSFNRYSPAPACSARSDLFPLIAFTVGALSLALDRVLAWRACSSGPWLHLDCSSSRARRPSHTSLYLSHSPAHHYRQSPIYSCRYLDSVLPGSGYKTIKSNKQKTGNNLHLRVASILGEKIKQ